MGGQAGGGLHQVPSPSSVFPSWVSFPSGRCTPVSVGGCCLANLLEGGQFPVHLPTTSLVSLHLFCIEQEQSGLFGHLLTIQCGVTVSHDSYVKEHKAQK